MIPILYNESATDFSSFGIGTLADCISCEVTEERNGGFECKLKYPTSGALFSELKKERIVKAKPNDTAASQAFRIYRITVPLNGVVTVYAQHISYDLAHVGVKPFELSAVSPQVAIEKVLQSTVLPHNFTFQTDYTASKPFKVEKPKSVRACLGGTEGSLMNLWGGEFEWDNFRIIHHQGRGRNNGVVIEYAKNLTSLEHDADISDVFSDLMPYAIIKNEDGSDGEVVTLPEVTLPVNTTLKVRKSAVKDFTEYFEYGSPITEDMLREKALAYIENNPLGIEAPSIKISFEPLWKQPEYAAILERVSLCDTVTVKHPQLGISVKTKVVKTTFDTIAEKYTQITLGSCKSNLTDTVRSISSEAKTTQKEVEKFPAMMKSAIATATSLITGQSGGYVVLHGGEGGQPYELLVLDAPRIEDAVNVWRWNMGGLGFSSHGYNGEYETAITADGSIVANFITSGTLAANIIKAGVLSSLDGNSYWNMETGEVVIKAYEEAVADLTSDVQTLSSELKQTASEIYAEVSSKVDDTYGSSTSSFGWKLKSTGFYVYSNASTVLTITSSGLSVVGAIDATSGSIGNLTIDGYLYFGGNTAYYISANYDDGNYYINLPGLKIDKASSAVFSGKLSAPSGTIGGFTISTSAIYASKTSYNSSTSGVYIGTDGIGLGAGTFYVTSAGKLYATNAEISGVITATSGTIGGFTINASSLTNASGGSSIQITSGNYTTYLGANSCYSTYYDGSGNRGWSLSHSEFRISAYTSGYYPGVKIKPNYTKRTSYTTNGNTTVAEGCITTNQIQSYYADSGSTIGSVSPFIIGISRSYMKSPYASQEEWGAYLRFASHNLAELVYDSYYSGKWQMRDVYTGRTYDLGGHKFYFWNYSSSVSNDSRVSISSTTHGLSSVSGAIVIPKEKSTTGEGSSLSGDNNLINKRANYGIYISGTTVYVVVDTNGLPNGFYCLIFGS